MLNDEKANEGNKQEPSDHHNDASSAETSPETPEQANFDADREGNEKKATAERPVPPPYWRQPPDSPWDPTFGVKSPIDDANPDEAREFRSARSLMTASNIMGPVSIFFGGVLLSGCGIVCAVMSMNRFKRLSGSSDKTMSSIANKMVKAAKASIAICVLAIVVNAISAALLFPVVMEAVESGQLDTLMGTEQIADGMSGSNESPSEVWG